MIEDVVHARVQRLPFIQSLFALPAAATHSRALLLRIGLTLLGRIKRAFIVKARGGTDEAGDRWQALSPKTVAYSRRGRSKTEKKRATRPSQALTKKQQERWWEMYRRSLARFKGDKSAAARVAWTILKAEGATTLFDKYGGRRVEILRDTGLLLNSLSPGSGSAEQVLRTGIGEVTVGTNRKGAAAHHRGIQGKLPRRPLWPDPRKWPSSWWQDILEQVQQGMLDIALQVIRSAI